MLCSSSLGTTAINRLLHRPSQKHPYRGLPRWHGTGSLMINRLLHRPSQKHPYRGLPRWLGTGSLMMDTLLYFLGNYLHTLRSFWAPLDSQMLSSCCLPSLMSIRRLEKGFSNRDDRGSKLQFADYLLDCSHRADMVLVAVCHRGRVVLWSL